MRVGPVSHVDQHGSAQGFQRRIDEDELSYDKAFSRVALDILGYDADAGVSSDGRGDHGVDYWIVDERAATGAGSAVPRKLKTGPHLLISDDSPGDRVAWIWLCRLVVLASRDGR